MSGKCVRAPPCDADEANGRLPGWHHVLLPAGPVRPDDLVAGDADLGRFLQGRPCRNAIAAQDDPIRLSDLHPQPGRLLVEARQLRQVLHRKAVPGRLEVEDGHGFPASGVIYIDMHDFQATAAPPPTPQAEELILAVFWLQKVIGG